ncbi:hypothetical protein FB446DRAFT_735259 [Lentinula raphanica]|nr:hypothetical protein FB446DRAFT_735259 [Lentinula raphanica]
MIRELTWTVYNIDKHAIISQPELWEFFWFPYSDSHGPTSDLTTHLLTTPIIIPSRYKTKPLIPDARKQIVKESAVSNLLSLPHELLAAIAEEVAAESYQDLILFAITRTTIWEATHPIRYRAICSEVEATSWAGSRIILLGSSSGRTFLNGILTDEEKAYFESGLQSYHSSDEDSDESSNEDFDEPDTNHIKAGKRANTAPFRQETSLDLPNINVMRGISSGSSYFRELLPYHHDHFSPWLSFIWGEFMPTKAKGENRIIRNLTKREYVTSPRYLTQMLYSLIGHFAGAFPEDSSWLALGDWAGDRIDSTFISNHKQEHGEESDWKDITERVREKLRAVQQEEMQRNDDADGFEF